MAACLIDRRSSYTQRYRPGLEAMKVLSKIRTRVLATRIGVTRRIDGYLSDFEVNSDLIICDWADSIALASSRFYRIRATAILIVPGVALCAGGTLGARRPVFGLSDA